MHGGPIFHEVQKFPLRRTAVAVIIPPCAMLGLLIYQVVLGHPWGNHPMSNASIIGWTVFLWALYARLLTVRLGTDVRDGELILAMRGMWRRWRIPLADITSAEEISFDPVRDFGGFGIRSGRAATSYIASSHEGVLVRLSSGKTVVVGSERPAELVAALGGVGMRLRGGR